MSVQKILCQDCNGTGSAWGATPCDCCDALKDAG
jgi:hypothetical protein